METRKRSRIKENSLKVNQTAAVDTERQGTSDSLQHSQETIDTTTDLPFDAKSWFDVKTKVNQTAAVDTERQGTSDSLQHSQETIDTTTDLPFDAKSWFDVKTKLQAIAWIQCDNQNCLKWRKVSKEEVNKVSESDKWFCHQNADPEFSSCDVPEENVELYDRLAIKSGLIYLKSELVSGALVWAKMSGYCSWPAVVTPEPDTEIGQAYRNEDDEITHYHVEFLGKPHSHGWVLSKDVKVFTAQSSDKQPAVAEQCGFRGRPRKVKKCRKKYLTTAQVRLKTTYKRGLSVENGVTEAMELLPISPSKRLKYCTFISRDKSKDLECERQTTELKATRASLSTRDVCTAPSTGKRLSSADIARTTASPNFTSFASTLNDRTKEERLMLDIEMYKRNERAFEHDVTRFMIRNGMKMCKGPVWQNQRISLFQLFLTVHERGGYDQVTCHRGWAAIYREVTEMPCNTDVQNSSATKTFYHRYLYPYELYIKGKDFRGLFQHQKEEDQKNQMTKKRTKHCMPNEKRTDTLKPYHRTICSAVDPEPNEGDEVASDSLMEMLQTLEENGRIGLEEVQMDNEIDITFYDESTPSKDQFPPLTAFEPQASPLQVVPSITTKHSAENEICATSPQVLQQLGNAPRVTKESVDLVCAQYTGDAAQILPSVLEGVEDASSASVFSHLLLNQLDALQEGISFINDQME